RTSALTVAGLCWNFTSFPYTSGISTTIRVYTIFRKPMWTPTHRLARIVLTIAISGLILPVNGAAAKPDKKKSQAGYQRGLRADEAGRRDEAISAYSQAIEADATNAAAWLPRGKNYLGA